MDETKNSTDHQWVYLTGKEIYNFFSRVKGKWKGITVYALVGKSGTGKSFRAKLLAEKLDIPHIIDDGLLIHGDTIIAGRSAKQEKLYLSAIKTALFSDQHHQEGIVQALKEQKVKKVLLLGTSRKMVERVADRLGLPPISQYIRIEEIASKKDIEDAIKSRFEEGKHVIPVPAIEVKRDYAQILSDSIRIFFSWDKRKEGEKKSRFFEKSIVQPDFHDEGRSEGNVTITEAALTQMIFHCIDEYDDEIQVKKVKIKVHPSGYSISLDIIITYGKTFNSILEDLRKYICDTIQRYTGIIIENLNIAVDEVVPRDKLPERSEVLDGKKDGKIRSIPLKSK
ncbi:Asp23/Gls24 family envelope stress response protein [Desulforhopalus singaporensis]|uniref:Asp23 family, cell envelope-related function n=1 Tax=Desulforhopalus singaporensis TaxID=91360 RepID=A0A1H0UGF1_9BACT|nr:Asp23/Gls24 family envelope stress response protein [Desulforhopalus singaporensis]SDP65221.1 Asp23 family, cell envelope-related function [Desulforhopalus singaporensis]